MKKLLYLFAVIALSFSLSLISCGPSKKLLNSEAKVDKLQKDSILTKSQLEDYYRQVKTLNDEKATLQSENSMVQNDLNIHNSESKMTIADQAKRLKIFQNLVQSQQEKMDHLKNAIENALMNYKMDELTVYTIDGNVYVLLEESLLFKSGSDNVSVKGKEALKSLATVLNTTKDISVMVEGHTDNVSIKTVQYKDNWDLSTARATSILRIMTIDYGFDSKRITASGKGEFHPIDSNDTAEGRAKNRRIEIILTPDLNEIFKLLDQQD